MRLLAALASTLVAGSAAAQTAGPQRAFISVDMEGIWGVVNREQIIPEGKDYAAARKWMADDVNAVVEGLLEAGATEVVVNDSHGGMRNILPGDLHPRASLLSGTPKPMVMMAGLDRSFAAALFVGYHAQAGTADAIADHTYSSAAVYQIRLNGAPMSESSLNSLHAALLGVPVVMLSGDEAACREAKRLVGEHVVTVAVKEALGRAAARMLPMNEARRLLREAAKQAFLGRAKVKLAPPKGPFNFEVAFVNALQAEVAAEVPGTTRKDGRTVTFSHARFEDAFRHLRALIALAAGV